MVRWKIVGHKLQSLSFELVFCQILLHGAKQILGFEAVLVGLKVLLDPFVLEALASIKPFFDIVFKHVLEKIHEIGRKPTVLEFSFKLFGFWVLNSFENFLSLISVVFFAISGL